MAGSLGQLPEVERGLAAVERALRYDPAHGPSLRFQATLRERRAALAAEVERLLGEARRLAAREEWEEVERAAQRVLAIDPGNRTAPGLQQDALRGMVEKHLRLAAQAEVAEDWREAARYLEAALGRDPRNEALRTRLQAARARDTLAYYLGRGRELEGAGELDRA